MLRDFPDSEYEPSGSHQTLPATNRFWSILLAVMFRVLRPLPTKARELRPFTGSPFAQTPWVKPGRKKLSAMLRSVGWKNGKVATSDRLPGTPGYPPGRGGPRLEA